MNNIMNDIEIFNKRVKFEMNEIEKFQDFIHPELIPLLISAAKKLDFRVKYFTERKAEKKVWKEISKLFSNNPKAQTGMTKLDRVGWYSFESDGSKVNSVKIEDIGIILYPTFFQEMECVNPIHEEACKKISSFFFEEYFTKPKQEFMKIQKEKGMKKHQLERAWYYKFISTAFED